ncbi:malate synthase G [Oleidesulfovibrio sp.]|uniref:malate synthase G n=1 Tax=Oleidesulfovibrio sp. TaxID=2909707 RepID=UPI003A896540
MINRIQSGGLQVASCLSCVVANEIAPDTGIDPVDFWAAAEDVFSEFIPRNRALLEKRETLQTAIDDWHLARKGQPHDAQAYRAFLQEIGYLLPEGDDFSICPQGVDPEISTVAGPQLVVPITNARYAVNAANARWGSLYDALYGSDVLPDEGELAKGSAYNAARGREVMARAMQFLDGAVPLAGGSHAAVTAYVLVDENGTKKLIARTASSDIQLAQPEKFVGFSMEGRAENADEPGVIVFCNNGLHIELHIDRAHLIGSAHPAGVKDVVLEAAVTTIQDCEDSVSAVDANDKSRTYQAWFGLIKGDIEASFVKNDKVLVRKLNTDRCYLKPDGTEFVLPGRSLMLIRNVGHLMTTDAVLMPEGTPVPEGILDALMTGYIALHELRGNVRYKNSRTGSVYIVKPKMHGPEEVQFTCDLFSRVEDLFGLPRNMLKIGIMDEERRTSLNLKECIRVARERVIFINTGFLDRTGDEIHTSMEAGPMVRKNDMKAERWIAAYEDWNVDVGLACGFSGRAQIGKGMWPKPDRLREMVETKSAHPLAGANCAWVPSPTAATLHAMHYHAVNVRAVQDELAGKPRAAREDMLELPLLDVAPDARSIREELENNAQSILGYVVRWVEQGIGCSKVPDIHNVGLMEDRATLRISSQHIANWIHHDICTREEVLEVFKRMAAVVDAQNEGHPAYSPMSPDFDRSVAFQAACDLVFKGKEQPSGYTEPVLHDRRREAKKRFGQV